MKQFIVTVFLVIIFTTLPAQQKPSYQFYFAKAKESYQSKEYQQFYEMIVKASNLHPYHQTILYYRGIAAALCNKPDEAIRYLRDAILINASLSLTIDDLHSLTNSDDFKDLLKLQQEANSTIIQSDTAFILKDRLLHAESITSGEKRGVFYVTSIHKRKVIKINGQTEEDFITEGQDGLGAILGIKLDSKKRYLWVCSSPMAEMKNFDTLSQSLVIKYDLITRKPLQKFMIDNESVVGDLLLNKKGEAFISDSKNNIIYKANERTRNLEVYFTSAEFWNIQGITFSPDERYLFIADYIKGIYRLETSTKTLTALKKNIHVSFKSVDGLLYYKNSLIAIQNGVTPMRVTQYFLNPSMDTIIDYIIIDRAHPAFNEPTNGCIVNDTLYYLANSQWSGYDDKHQPKPKDQMQDIIILKSKLVR